MVRTMTSFSSLLNSVLTKIERGLDRAGDDCDPSLWRLRLGADSAFDMLSRDDADHHRDRPHITTI